MTWLPDKSQPSGGAKQPEVAAYSFDVPVKFRTRAVNEAVQGTLLHIAVSGCRLRSWLLMDRGTAISFEWRVSSGKAIALSGVIAARYAPRNGGVGFEYAVAFERIAEQDADAIARDAAFLARKAASARAYDTSLVDISQFTGYRVPGDFAVAYRFDDPRIGARIGQASDVSGNALRLCAEDQLRIGQVLSLSFRLPDGVLGVHQGKDDEMIVGPFGYRRVPRRYLRRPFEELRVRARVAANVKDSRGRDAYEMELLEIDGLAREEVARYIHAAQLAHLRRR